MSDVAGPTALVLLLFIGFFKGAPLLRSAPVDLTAVCVALVAVGIVGHLLLTHGRARVRPWALVLVGLAAPAALYPVTNPAAVDKRVKLLIPLIVVLGVCYLIRTPRHQQLWVWLHVAVGVVLVATGAAADDNSGTRFTGVASNTIGAGRASGVAILVLILLLTSGGLPRWWQKLSALGVIGWLNVALISTGSRGPVFSCAAAVLVVATLGLGRHRFLRALTALGAVSAGWLLLNEATGLGATRLTGSLTGQYSLTGSRSGVWREALDAVLVHPLGIGWGNFWAVLPPAERLDSGYVQYPHNVLLEVFLEAGWLAGLAVAVFVATSLVRLYRSSYSPYGSALLGIAVFFVLNALVSGNVNDNRMMWAAVAMAWTDPAAAQPLVVRRTAARTSRANAR